MKYPTEYPKGSGNSSEEVTYHYDGADRLLKKVTPQGTIQYSYNQAGALEMLQTFHGGTPSLKLRYRLDGLNRIHQVVDETTGSALTTGYDYEPLPDLFRV